MNQKYGVDQYENIKYDNKTWETETFKLKPGQNKITVFAKANNQSYSSKSIKVYYDTGKGYEVDAKNIKYDKKEDRYYNNIVMIDFEEEVSETRRNEIVESINGRVVGRINILDEFHVEVPQRSLSELEKLCDKLEELDEVSMAFLDDISVTDQKSKSTEGKIDFENTWHIPKLEAVEAWDLQEKNSKEFSNINIGIVDSGFSEEHHDLNINIVNKDKNEEVEDKSHGTQVAGIIGGNLNENEKIRGIMSNANMYGFSIQKVGILEDLFVASTTKAREGLVNLVERDCKVINFSNGLDTKDKYSDEIVLSDHRIKENGETFSKTIAELLEKEYDFLVVQAAGNGAKIRGGDEKNKKGVDAIYNGLFTSITEENCYSNDKISKDEIMNRVIVVTAIQSDSKRSRSANGGKQVDIAAPGDGIYTTSINNTYKSVEGTSFAAPIVTGIAGLTWSADKSNLDGKEVRQIVLSSCRDMSKNNSDSNTYGEYPIANAKRAVEKVLQKKGVIEKNEEYTYEIISEEDKTIAIVKGNNLYGQVTIPAFLDGYNVIEIKDYAFYGCTELTEIQIPDSVNKIGSDAFGGCSKLSQINLGNGVETLGYRAIKDTAIESIIIPKSVKVMNYAIHENRQLKEVIFEEGTNRIPEYALSSYLETYGTIEKVTIPSTVEEIGSYAFKDCTGIKEIQVPDSVIRIGEGAFNYCTGIKGVIIPDKVAEIKDYAFYGCTELTEIQIPDSVIRIGDRAFSYCTAIKELKISANIMNLGWDIFYGCGTELTVLCYENSDIHKYVLNNNIAFRLI